LLNGLDDIGQTLEKKSKIDNYEGKAKAERPWL
jgi:3-isopropylmalate/(R)-2-methylmalate dehydratase small subunit